MDGLISSFQYSSSRFSTFSHNERTDDDKKAKNAPSNTTQNSTTAAQTLITDSITERDSNSGSGNRGGSGNNAMRAVAELSGTQFNTTLGNHIASEAIVNKALEVVQSVRNSLFEDLQKALGVSSDVAKDFLDKNGLEVFNNNGLTLEFDTVLVSGGQSQTVSASISLSQSFVSANFDSTQLQSFNAVRTLMSVFGQSNSGFTSLEDWITKAYQANEPASNNTNPKLTDMLLQQNSVSVSISTVEMTSATINAWNNRAANVNANVSSLSFSASITQIQMNANVNIGVFGERDVVGFIDPLVIDLGGEGVELSSDIFNFDLDADGRVDQISRPTGNSGFLALDKNNDGTINDGNELFGTQNGDGFKDLARYDSNNDGKIDKNDPVYNRLQIWKPDSNGGKGQLIGLGEVGIGAIYLDARHNEQLMQSSSGETLGMQRKSAAYERLDGTQGQIHHIDLAKRNSNSHASINKEKGIAAYSKMQGDLDRLRILTGRPTEESANVVSTYIMANNAGRMGSEISKSPEELHRKIDAIQQGNVDEDDVMLAQLDALLSKDTTNNGLVALLDRLVFDGGISSLNDRTFNYQALVNAQRLLA